MKKILFMTAMMVASLTAGAQSRFDAGSFTLQPRLGGTGSMFVNAPDMKVDGKTIETTATGGEFIGIDAEYHISRRFTIAAGVNYAAAGNGWKDYEYAHDDYGKLDVKEQAWKTNYINIPITANWYVLKGFALKAGVQFGFLTSAKEYMRGEGTAEGIDITLTAEKSVKDDFNKFDISIPVGLSYEFKLPIVLDLRYNIGVSKLNKNDNIGGTALDGKTLSNIGATITIGYKFQL